LNLEYAEQCAGVNNRSVQHLARAFPRLQSLNLEGNHQVGDVAVLALAKHCSGLITLNLQHTSVSVDALVRYLPKLRKLVRLAVGNFFFFDLGGAALMALATECSELVELGFEVGTGEFVGPDDWKDIEAVESLMWERRRARKCALGPAWLPSFAWSADHI
jgi:hypothetical protein